MIVVISRTHGVVSSWGFVLLLTINEALNKHPESHKYKYCVDIALLDQLTYSSQLYFF